MIQVRNVPERVHRELVRRAKAKGQTLTTFIEEILEREVSRPTMDEVLDRIKTREPVFLDRPASEYIREERAERERRR
jgi:hypothetical protein